MAESGFADLVAAVAEGMGQRPDSVRSTPDGYVLHTADGFLFAFLEDPARVSLASIERLLDGPAGRTGKVVLLTPGRLPLALAQRAQAGRASLVEHDRFRELLRGLDLGVFLGEEPRGPHDVPGARLLPSARRMDAVVARARTWLDWGVPALALRFYRQSLAQKPGFGPARIGIARALAGLGLWDESRAAFEEVLREHPGDIEARLGLAGLLGESGHRSEEIRLFREVLSERPERDDVRAQLIAALLEAHDRPGARAELALMLRTTPEAPKLRYLHGLVLRSLGEESEADREIAQARALGLAASEERPLAEHAGLPPPPPRAEPALTPAPVGPAPRPIREEPLPAPRVTSKSPKPRGRSPKPKRPARAAAPARKKARQSG